MVPIEQLRKWAGVAGTEEDATLRLIEAGALDFISRATNRILRSPPAPYTETLDVPAARSGGVSGVDARADQRVRLAEEPQPDLPGTVSVTAGTTTVNGTGTLFTQHLSADPASAIEIAEEPILVSAITSDTELELAEAHVGGATDVTAHAPLISLRHRTHALRPWSTLDPRDFEIDGRAVHTTDVSLHSGRRTLEISYLLGDEEGEGPDDVVLVLLRIIKSLWASKRRRSKSVSVEGAFKISWADLKDEAAAFRAELAELRRPVGF